MGYIDLVVPEQRVTIVADISEEAADDLFASGDIDYEYEVLVGEALTDLDYHYEYEEN